MFHISLETLVFFCFVLWVFVFVFLNYLRVRERERIELGGEGEAGFPRAGSLMLRWVPGLQECDLS